MNRCPTSDLILHHVCYIYYHCTAVILLDYYYCFAATSATSAITITITTTIITVVATIITDIVP